jgi:hypothetical protein
MPDKLLIKMLNNFLKEQNKLRIKNKNQNRTSILQINNKICLLIIYQINLINKFNNQSNYLSKLSLIY